jgi:TrmH family RNA methyltransferase
MLSKSQIQYIKSLAINKYRRLNRQFIAEGPKLIAELLTSRFVCDRIFALPEWIESYSAQIPKIINITEITEKELERISTLKTPNQVLALINIPEPADIEIPLPYENIILMLDNISDPGNMGTIIRTADWFGIHNILCSENCVDIYNPRVVQATMGSLFRVNVHYISFEKYLKGLPKNVPVYAAVLDGDNLYESELNVGYVIIGNESHGVSQNLMPFVNKKIKIPDYPNGRSTAAESLNASVAAALVMAEFRRKTASGK